MPSNFSSIGFDLAARSSSKQPRRLEAGERFTLVVLGDFAGRASRGVVEPLHQSRLRQVDVDTYARVFAQFGARLQLSGAAFPGGTLELAFASMDDWHPDRLLTQVPWLASLIEARALLLNPATAERGRAALEACLGQAKAVPTEPPATAAAPQSPILQILSSCLKCFLNPPFKIHHPKFSYPPIPPCCSLCDNPCFRIR
jgi:type VI secretion system ImpB/VipA family protein